MVIVRFVTGGMVGQKDILPLVMIFITTLVC